MSRSFASRAALVAAFGFSLLTSALPSVAAETYTKEHLAAARAAIEASHVADGFDNLIMAVAEQAKSNFIRSNPSYSNQIESAVNKSALELASQRVELDRQIQQIWASKFTQAELQEIAKFYGSAVGQKLAKETSPMVTMVYQVVQVYQQKLSQDMVTKTRDELKKQNLPF